MNYQNNGFDDEYIYNNLEFGDIIWAKRYNNPKQLKKIPEGHENGPYLVIGKDKNGIKCFYGTSTEPKKEFLYYRILTLNEKSYYLPKTSYINIARPTYITQDRFIKRLGHLNYDDKHSLLKKIDLAHKDGIYHNIDIEKINIPLEKTDIITNGSKYYLIIEETEKNYICIEMSEDKNFSNFSVSINGRKHYLNLDKTVSYSKILEPIRVNFIEDTTFQNILAMKKQRQNYLEHKKEISRGSLINYNNNLYYIYGEINDKWMTFELTEVPNSKLYNISIDNKNYYTDFNNNIEISKTETNIEVITTANDYEIAKIKETKKSYIKIKQKENKKEKQDTIEVMKPEINCGTLIKYENMNAPYLYLVLTRNQDRFVVIEYNKYLEGKYILDILYADQMEYYNKIDNITLLEVLYNLRDITKGFIKKNKLEQMITTLEEETPIKKLTL